jgi:hypothetical protein
MTPKVSTTFTSRRPALVRVWRTTGLPGSPLTSSWLSSETTATDTPAEGGRRR